MNRLFRTGLLVAGLLLIGSSLLYADALQYTNNRPVSVGTTSYDGQGYDLQSLFNANSSAFPFNVITDQQIAGYWTLGGLHPSAIPVVSFEITANKDTMQMGIFSDTNGDNDANGRTLVDIFNASASAGTSATLAFNSSGSLTITGTSNAVNNGTFTGITASGFGFYIQPTGDTGPTWYSLDQLNGGLAQMLAFRDTNPNRWTLAFEDIAVKNSNGGANGDYDYNDFIFQIESIVPVPEPASLMLLGFGLIGLGYAARKKRYNKANRGRC